jgi:hypothetical protein
MHSGRPPVDIGQVLQRFGLARLHLGLVRKNILGHQHRKRSMEMPTFIHCL